jgi:hypothetical protein
MATVSRKRKSMSVVADVDIPVRTIKQRYVLPYPSLEYPVCAYNCKIKLAPSRPGARDKFYDVGPFWRGDEVQRLRTAGGSHRWAFWVLLSFTGEIESGRIEPAPIGRYVSAKNEDLMCKHTGCVMCMFS